MDKAIKERLDDILNKYSAQQASREETVQKRKSEREIFLKRFEELVSDIIRPAMQELADHLKERGHDCEIVTKGLASNNDVEQNEPSITLDIFLEGRRPAFPNQEFHPSVTFRASDYKNEIIVYERYIMLGGHGSGPGGEYEMEQITPAVIHEHILKVIGKAIGG